MYCMYAKDDRDSKLRQHLSTMNDQKEQWQRAIADLKRREDLVVRLRTTLSSINLKCMYKYLKGLYLILHFNSVRHIKAFVCMYIYMLHILCNSEWNYRTSGSAVTSNASESCKSW